MWHIGKALICEELHNFAIRIDSSIEFAIQLQEEVLAVTNRGADAGRIRRRIKIRAKVLPRMAKHARMSRDQRTLLAVKMLSLEDGRQHGIGERAIEYPRVKDRTAILGQHETGDHRIRRL